MSIRNVRFLRAIAVGSAALMLASCAATDPTATSPAPVATMSSPSTPVETAERGAGAYIPYASFASQREKYVDSQVVLFFNATWCSTCQEARENFEASLKEIPENLVIVVVDFDNSIDLRKEYGVTVQHTFVQIDKTGGAIGKWSGSVTVAQIVENLA